MIIWTRKGILGFVIPFGVAIICQLLFGETPLIAGIGYTVSAIPVWWLGRKWNTKVPPKKHKHTLFWIHLEYWGILAALLGLIIVVSETFIQLDSDIYFIIMGIALVPILILQYSKSNSSFIDILHKIAPFRIVDPQELPKSLTTLKSAPTPKTVTRIKNNEKKSTVVSRPKAPSNSKSIALEKLKNESLKNFEPSDHSRFMPLMTDPLDTTRTEMAEKVQERSNRDIEQS